MNQNNNHHPKERSNLKNIGIIGGGIAGLSCASHLASYDYFTKITVFDTGRLRPGGRCSSRYPKDESKQNHGPLTNTILDHAAQMITISKSSLSSTNPTAFVQQLLEWEKEGIIKRYPNKSVYEIQKKKNKNKKSSLFIKTLNANDSNRVMFYGTNGTGSIPMAIANQNKLDIQQDVWVSPSNGVKYIQNKSSSSIWKIKAKGKVLGEYQQIVIAHNGKCADRLMSRTPAKSLHSLLRTNFSPTVPNYGGKKMTLNSIYSLTFAIPTKTIQNIPSSYISGFIQNHPNLSFLSCATKKYPSSSSDNNIQIWTLLSSSKFAKRYKAPQENLPDEIVKEVTYRMLQSLEESLELKNGTLAYLDPTKESFCTSVLDSKLQLWGAAVPLNTWKSNDIINNTPVEGGFLYDSQYNVGACGDWLLKSSIEGAWESGRRLAQWMMKVEQEKNQKDDFNKWCVGLPPNGFFSASSAVSKAGIGSFS